MVVIKVSDFIDYKVKKIVNRKACNVDYKLMGIKDNEFPKEEEVIIFTLPSYGDPRLDAKVPAGYVANVVGMTIGALSESDLNPALIDVFSKLTEALQWIVSSESWQIGEFTTEDQMATKRKLRSIMKRIGKGDK